MREKTQRNAEQTVSQGTPWDSRGSPREFLSLFSWGIPQETPCFFQELPGKADRALASLEATAGMEKSGQSLMGASPCRPGDDQENTGGRGKQEASEQMTCFRHREGAQIGGYDGFCWLLLPSQQRGGTAQSFQGDTGQKRQGQHDQGDMAIPSQEAAHFVVIEPQVFAILKIFFDAKASSQSGDFGLQRGLGGSKDQVVGQVWGGSDAATDEQAVPPIIATLMPHGHARPLKETRPFAALAHRQGLPVVLGKQRCHVAHLQPA